jgi:hypothetical protein
MTTWLRIDRDAARGAQRAEAARVACSGTLAAALAGAAAVSAAVSAAGVAALASTAASRRHSARKVGFTGDSGRWGWLQCAPEPIPATPGGKRGAATAALPGRARTALDSLLRRLYIHPKG